MPFVRLVVVLFIVVSMQVQAFSQVDVSTATLRGTVTDGQGATLAGANLTVRNPARGFSRLVTANADGTFIIPLLPPGTYEIVVEVNGFAPALVKGIELSVGQIQVIDPHLAISAVTSEVIEVAADVPIVEVARTQQSNTINSRQIQNLPNLSRDFTSYVFTLPGVTDSNAPRAQFVGFDVSFTSSGFSVGGGNGRNNLVTVDGGENEFGTGQLRVRNLSPEAVQEFQVNRNSFGAEFGFTSGSAVNVVTKSGTNQWQGSLYAFFRSQKIAARNYFDRDPQKAFDQKLYPGFTVGGPLVKNKLFLFSSFEALKADAARFRNYTANASALGVSAGQAAYLNRLAASGDTTLRQIAGQLQSALVTANYPATLRLLQANQGVFQSPSRSWNWTTRLDWNLNAKDVISGRFSLAHDDQDQLTSNNDQSPSANTTVKLRDVTALVTWTHIFSPTVVNQVRGQVVPNFSARTLPKAPDSTGISIVGIGTFGQPNLVETFADRYQIEDILTLNQASHTFKFGASYRPVSYRVVNGQYFAALWTFSANVFPIGQALPESARVKLTAYNIAQGLPANGPADTGLTALQSFNLGLPGQYLQGFNNPKWSGVTHGLGAFAQDSWKINPRLTMDAGIRFDFDQQPGKIGGHSYLSPRLGFAWDVWGTHKTVVRGGGGIFVAPINFQVPLRTTIQNDSGAYLNQVIRTAADGAQSAAALWQYGVKLGALPGHLLTETQVNAFGIYTGPRSAGRRINEPSPAYRNPYAIQASLGISHQLAQNLALDVAYQMNRGVHLQVSQNVNYRETNVIDPIYGPRLARLDPTIAQLNLYSSIGNSIYHGLTATLTKRFSRNTQFEANYTFSKVIDDVIDFNATFSAFLPTRLYLERSVSAFDIPHTVTVNGVFQSPFRSGAQGNWLGHVLGDLTVSPIVTLHSGVPFTVRAGRDVNGDTSGNYDRPFYAGRNTGRGAAFVSVNLRLAKRLRLPGEKISAELIVEATNLLNHTNFLSVNDVIGGNPKLLAGPFNLRGRKDLSPTIPLGFTSAGDPRQLQFGLKLWF
ncbi:MAG: carboxypeptidase regulatory-like domain-containing protein [Blastocatellia bacterium]|nr:carboxypeptidase regulatory-like domain-containing protein [Blastocatellia bacterium]